MEFSANKKLYVLVAVLGIVIVSLLVVLIFVKKKNSPGTVQTKQEAVDPNQGKSLEELTTAPSGNVENDPEVNAKLQEMISAPDPSASKNTNVNGVEKVNPEKLNAKEEQPPMSKELQDMLTAPNPK